VYVVHICANVVLLSHLLLILLIRFHFEPKVALIVIAIAARFQPEVSAFIFVANLAAQPDLVLGRFEQKSGLHSFILVLCIKRTLSFANKSVSSCTKVFVDGPYIQFTHTPPPPQV
jgi:hypothetical protein